MDCGWDLVLRFMLPLRVAELGNDAGLRNTNKSMFRAPRKTAGRTSIFSLLQQICKLVRSEHIPPLVEHDEELRGLVDAR